LIVLFKKRKICHGKSEVGLLAPIAMESPQLKRLPLWVSKRGLAMESGTKSFCEFTISLQKNKRPFPHVNVTVKCYVELLKG